MKPQPRRYEKHGLTKTRAYGIWIGMLNRCYKPNTTHYDRYGGRGIGVCDRWRNSFQAFVDDMGEPPAKFTLERKNNDKDYSKSNCRWASRWEQSINRHDNVLITAHGKTKTMAEWSRITGIPYDCLVWRKGRAGWTDEDCLKPTRQLPKTLNYEGRDYSIAEIAARTGVSVPSVHLRIKKGWPIEDIFNRPNSQPYMIKGQRYGVKATSTETPPASPPVACPAQPGAAP